MAARVRPGPRLRTRARQTPRQSTKCCGGASKASARSPTSPSPTPRADRPVARNGPPAAPAASELSPAGRTLLEFFRQHADAGLQISEPIRGADGHWTALLARRIDAPDGTFDGMAAASLNLSYFEDFYKAVELTENGAILLHRRDGTVLARYPHNDAVVGQSYADLPPFRDSSHATSPARWSWTARSTAAGACSPSAPSDVPARGERVGLRRPRAGAVVAGDLHFHGRRRRHGHAHRGLAAAGGARNREGRGAAGRVPRARDAAEARHRAAAGGNGGARAGRSGAAPGPAHRGRGPAHRRRRP